MNPIPWAFANWKLLLGGLLLTALALQTWRSSNLKDDIASCEARNLAQVSEWRAKYAQSVTEATQAKAEREVAQNKVTSDANENYRRRAAAFDRGVRKAATNPGSAGKADLPGLAYAPSVFDRPGDSVVISKDDARLCGVNTLRLIAAHEWAIKQSQTSGGN
jgi:hypothetical protein